jgi:hypothetical protein
METVAQKFQVSMETPLKIPLKKFQVSMETPFKSTQ